MSPSRLGSKTVHESWPLTRLLSDVAFVIRTRTVSVARCLVVVAMAVEQLEVVSPIYPPTPARDDVIDFHPIILRKEQSTLQALALLSLQESRDARRDLWVVAEARTPIHPIAIIGATHSRDFHVPTDCRLPVTVQAGFTIGRLKDPAVSCSEGPVPMRDPPFALVRVAVGRPGAQHAIEPVIQTLEGPGTAHAGIVACPSDNDRVEESDQRLLAGMTMALDDRAEVLDMVLDGLGTGHDPRLVP